MTRRFNWPLWTGFALSVAGFLSYFLVLSRFPATRDVPWISFLIFAGAIVPTAIGVRRAPRKIPAAVVAGITFAIAAIFFVAIFVSSKVPSSPGAPAVGAKAPDFVLLDTNRHPVALAQLLAAPGGKGIILIFYRGWW